jgi:hypothetical protein
VLFTLGATKVSEVTSKTATTAKRAMARTAKRETAKNGGSAESGNCGDGRDVRGFGWNVLRWFLELEVSCILELKLGEFMMA